MARRYESIDLVVVIGLCATIASAFTMVYAAKGSLQLADAVLAGNRTFDGPTTEGQWVQPVIGRGVVTDTLLERAFSQRIASAAGQLVEAFVTRHRAEATVDPVVMGSELSARMEAAHQAHLQTILGYTIVNFVQRGARTGALSSQAVAQDYTHRMFAALDNARQRLDHDFDANWQANLGRAIVSAVQTQMNVRAETEARLGRAIVDLVRVQHGYEQERAESQARLGSLVLASLMTRTSAEQSAGSDLVEARAASHGTGLWPELSFGYLVASCLGLLGIMILAFRFPDRRVDEAPLAAAPPDAGARVYRQAV